MKYVIAVIVIIIVGFTVAFTVMSWKLANDLEEQSKGVCTEDMWCWNSLVDGNHWGHDDPLYHGQHP